MTKNWEYGLNILEVQFKQREFDGKWERIAKIVDYDNKYTSVSYTHLTLPTKRIV